jgi:hypothetical protein
MLCASLLTGCMSVVSTDIHNIVEARALRGAHVLTIMQKPWKGADVLGTPGGVHGWERMYMDVSGCTMYYIVHSTRDP